MMPDNPESSVKVRVRASCPGCTGRFCPNFANAEVRLSNGVSYAVECWATYRRRPGRCCNRLDTIVTIPAGVRIVRVYHDGVSVPFHTEELDGEYGRYGV